MCEPPFVPDVSFLDFFHLFKLLDLILYIERRKYKIKVF